MTKSIKETEKWSSLLEKSTSLVHKFGKLEVRKLNRSRDILDMMVYFDTVNDLTNACVFNLDKTVRDIAREPMLSDGRKINFIKDRYGKSYVLEDRIISGCSFDSPWVFMGEKYADIIFLSDDIEVSNLTDRELSINRIGVTSSGSIAYKSYSSMTDNDFLDYIVKHELLKTKIRISHDCIEAKTEHLNCLCEPTINDRYVIVRVFAYKKGYTKKSWAVIYDRIEEKVLDNKIYKEIEMLRGVYNIFNGLYAVRENERIGNKTVIDLKPKEADVLIECFEFYPIDGYYIIVDYGNIMNIAKFNPYTRELECLLDESVEKCSYHMVNGYLELTDSKNRNKVIYRIKSKTSIFMNSNSLEEIVCKKDIMHY